MTIEERNGLAIRYLYIAEREARNANYRYRRITRVDKDDALDVAYQALFEAIEKYDPAKGMRLIGAYISCIIRNKIRYLYITTKKKNHESLDRLLDEKNIEFSSNNPSPEKNAQINDFRKILKTSIRCLNRREKIIIIGHFFLGYRVVELANLLSRTKGPISNTKRKALVKLRTRLENKYGLKSAA